MAIGYDNGDRIIWVILFLCRCSLAHSCRNNSMVCKGISRKVPETVNHTVWSEHCPSIGWRHTLIARFMGPTWGPSGADKTQVGPMLAPWTLLSGQWLRVGTITVTLPHHRTGFKRNMDGHILWNFAGYFIRGVVSLVSTSTPLFTDARS